MALAKRYGRDGLRTLWPSATSQAKVLKVEGNICLKMLTVCRLTSGMH